MGGFSAVRPGTDLPRYAHQLARVHDAVLSGSASSDAPRAVVARSWSRMLAAGRTADSAGNRAVADPAELERRRRATALQYVIDELGQVIEAIADASHMLMVVADADGVILWRSGSAAVRRHADRLGFAEGAEWTEQQVGTNAIGTALTEAAPVQLFSAEHFEQSQHPWYCTASPIHDPRTGRLLGVVDVSGPAMTLHPTVVALVETAVRMAESQLWRHHESRLERLRSSAAAALAGRSGPALLVDTEGWVAQSDGVSVGGRVPVPHPDKPMQVPGMGSCGAEQVAGGWLIRPTGSSARIALTLTLTSEPTISGGVGADSGAAALTARHAEILLLLCVHGPDGVSAAQLSRGLFGDAEHVVTVRAEVSRLRRVLGGIVLSRPYRLADSVELTLDPAGAGRAAQSPFVQRVACPEVRGAVAGLRY
ncbi:helix-turn-helix domain-containing protein [Tomitella fengzijianii]|uniref:GAF domain-containing protein n=1 Tax=Tomitella fengzijianii TaxID=2597660 RepID=A0A516X0V6_9ACTN|nr:helix-turn-helix domain-containing protein [Tomitella fengzijianii]QDQ96724.1 GAF domain-containing protein [Tomitella fengzijianii]